MILTQFRQAVRLSDFALGKVGVRWVMTYMPHPFPTHPKAAIQGQRGFAAIAFPLGQAAPTFWQILSKVFAPWQDALIAAGSPISIAPSDDLFTFHLERGIALFHLGRYPAALAEFRTALRLEWRDEQAASWMDRAEEACRHNRTTRSYEICAP